MARPIRRAITVLLAIAAVVAVALMLAQDQETLTIHSAKGAQDAGAPAYVAALVGADLTRGNHYDVLTNGDQIFPAMLDAIRAAKRRISLEIYIYDSGTVAGEFTTALADAARRGVRVDIVVDAVGAGSMDDAAGRRLKEAR